MVDVDEITEQTLKITEKTLALSSQHIKLIDEVNNQVDKLFESIQAYQEGKTINADEQLKAPPKKFTRRLSL